MSHMTTGSVIIHTSETTPAPRPILMISEEYEVDEVDEDRDDDNNVDKNDNSNDNISPSRLMSTRQGIEVKESWCDEALCIAIETDTQWPLLYKEDRTKVNKWASCFGSIIIDYNTLYQNESYFINNYNNYYDNNNNVSNDDKTDEIELLFAEKFGKYIEWEIEIEKLNGKDDNIIIGICEYNEIINKKRKEINDGNNNDHFIKDNEIAYGFNNCGQIMGGIFELRKNLRVNRKLEFNEHSKIILRLDYSSNIFKWKLLACVYNEGTQRENFTQNDFIVVFDNIMPGIYRLGTALWAAGNTLRLTGCIVYGAKELDPAFGKCHPNPPFHNDKDNNKVNKKVSFNKETMLSKNDDNNNNPTSHDDDNDGNNNDNDGNNNDNDGNEQKKATCFNKSKSTYHYKTYCCCFARKIKRKRN